MANLVTFCIIVNFAALRIVILSLIAYSIFFIMPHLLLLLATAIIIFVLIIVFLLLLTALFFVVVLGPTLLLKLITVFLPLLPLSMRRSERLSVVRHL